MPPPVAAGGRGEAGGQGLPAGDGEEDAQTPDDDGVFERDPGAAERKAQAAEQAGFGLGFGACLGLGLEMGEEIGGFDAEEAGEQRAQGFQPGILENAGLGGLGGGVRVCVFHGCQCS